MVENKWRRFSILEKSLASLSIFNIAFPILNDFLFNLKIPEHIEGYFFFFSLGLYLGFILCKKEYNRVEKKAYQDPENNNKN